MKVNLKRIQEELRKKISLSFTQNEIHYVAGCDVAYTSTKSIASIAVLEFPELKLVDFSFHVGKISFPYVAGFLAFREAPSIVTAIAKLTKNVDIFILDGHGIAHPRKMGLATYTGILIGKPTIGCAKSLLVGSCNDCQDKKGSFSYILFDDEIVGACLRTREGTKPVFISPGNHIDLENSIRIILQCTTHYRIPEPLRIAHLMANRMRKLLEGCGKCV